MPPSDNSNPSFNFEKALEELHHIVEQMEQGKLSLDQSLAMFERGVSITRQCQQVLQEAEQHVQILLQQNNQDQLVDFKHSSDEN